jgi:hypothetical protein
VIRVALAVLLLSLAGPAIAQPAIAQSRSEGPTLDRPDAFERAYAVSTFSFDACGDPLAGRMYRRALADKFAHCPFSPEARSRFREQTRAQLAKTRQAMESMIEDHGGLPMQLDGMPLTCHEQQASDGYKRFRSLLDQYAQGSLPAEAVIAAPCDAPDIAP